MKDLCWKWYQGQLSVYGVNRKPGMMKSSDYLEEELNPFHFFLLE
jgi:hypothetical protein